MRLLYVLETLVIAAAVLLGTVWPSAYTIIGVILHHRPQEADEFARDRDNGDLWPLAIREVLIPLMEALLRLPRMTNDRRWLALLPPPNLDTQVRAIVIGPRRLTSTCRQWLLPAFVMEPLRSRSP